MTITLPTTEISDFDMCEIMRVRFEKNHVDYEWNTHSEDLPYFYTNDTEPGHGFLVLCRDPRLSMEEAVDFLHWFVGKYATGYHWYQDGWHIWNEDNEYLIPITGENFILAIFHVAKLIMEI